MAPDTASPKNSGLGLQWTGGVRLSWRILAVNIIALVLLAGGFFYIDSYRTRVIDARLDESKQELSLLASALDIAPPDKRDTLIVAFAHQMEDRIRLYDQSGALVTDSFLIGGPRFELVRPEDEPLKRHVARFLDKVIDKVVGADRLPDYREPQPDRAAGWTEIAAADARGETVAMAR